MSPFFFTGVGKRIGAFATNLLRLGIAFLVLLALLGVRAWLGATPAALHPAAWIWLISSGVIGLAIGDAFLYRAFVSIGPERTSQIQTLAPAATAALAWVSLKEFLSLGQLGGMALILAGVFLATSGGAGTARKKSETEEMGGKETGTAQGPAGTALLVAEARMEGAVVPAEAVTSEIPKPASYLKSGLWAAVWSALFQGLGTVLARKAFLDQADLDPLAATTVRLGAGATALWIYARATGPLARTLGGWRDGRVLRLLLAGTLFGPLIGMCCYIGALKLAPAGVVTTITFMAPLVIIPIGARLYRTRIAASTLWGTALSAAGVVLLGLG